MTFAMIYVKFNNHERILYSLWKGHGEIKKKPANIFGVERRHISNFPRSKRTLIHMYGAKITALGTCIHKLVYLRCLNCTRLKCTQSTLTVKYIFFIMIYVYSCLYYYLCIFRPIC